MDRLTSHQPLLVNTIAYAAGTILFLVFLYLLRRDPIGARLRASHLSVLTAVLALLWNGASLLVIGLRETASPLTEPLLAISTSALSLLPAVLLHLSLGGRFRAVCYAGYAVSAAAAGLHWSELLFAAPHLHWFALRFITWSFGLLTVLAAALLVWRPAGGARGRTPRLIGTMALFLFALSFVRFGLGELPQGWPLELLIHHAGIPLALFVLLQDFRFILLDAVARVAANLLAAGAAVFAAFWLIREAGIPPAWAGSPFWSGIAVVGASLALIGFALLRTRFQELLTRLLFRRPDLATALHRLRTHPDIAAEAEYLDWALSEIADFMSASLLPGDPALDVRLREQALHHPAPVSELPGCRELLEQRGVHLVLPVRVSQNELHFFLLGRRVGGRPYLSEDLEAIERLTEQVVEHVSHFRELETSRLVTQAELRALHSQIHPHFLFNALNTLYGVIPKQASRARELVLNLSDMLRYFLRGDRTHIPLEEELRVVRAYLDIEKLRLGDRLEVAVEAPPGALPVPIPVLSIQPLVENAVKHGVAAQPGGGRVRVSVELEGGRLRVSVSDTGRGFATVGRRQAAGHGVGLENVNRRLRLCYGEDAGVQIRSDGQGATVSFSVPARVPAGVNA